MADLTPARVVGLVLALVGVVGTLWLAATDRLGLYIHPRYFVFTTVMAVVAGVLCVAALVTGLARRAEADPEETPSRHPRWRVVAAAVSSLTVVLLTTGAVLVLPPATLTTATVDQRDMNAGAATELDSSVDLAGVDTADFTVKDWAALLRQGTADDVLADASPTLTGFVTPDPDAPDDVFFLARFTVTCCAVDAQPVGVPVHLPGWRDTYPVDGWVTVSGPFRPNPSSASAQAWAIVPDEIEAVSQPAQPYVY